MCHCAPETGLLRRRALVLKKGDVIDEQPHWSIVGFSVPARAIHDDLQLVTTGICVFLGFPAVRNGTKKCLCLSSCPSCHLFMTHQGTLQSVWTLEAMIFNLLALRNQLPCFAQRPQVFCTHQADVRVLQKHCQSHWIIQGISDLFAFHRHPVMKRTAAY